MILNFEIIPLVFILGMIYFTYVSFKKKQLSKPGFLFWNFIWLLCIILILFHPYIKNILSPLNINRVFDLYTILGFLFFFFIIFYLFRQYNRTEKKIEELTRKLALKGLLDRKNLVNNFALF
jgi:hypothetical protein